MKKLTILLLTVMTVFCVTGCIERKLTITSEPAGALVIISDKEIGRTPVTHEFLWHGEYDIILRFPEKGYKTLNESANLNMRWYQYPPIDLFSSIAPWTYKDHRYLHYKLQKMDPPDNAALIKRAEQMQKANDMPVSK